MNEENKTILEFLKPHPIEAQEQKIRELRASKNFVDIQKKSRAPKGKYCDWCENQTTKYEPRICSWNGEVTEIVSFPYCSFFNSRLDEDKDASNGCYASYVKCLACLIQTSAIADNENED